MRLIVFALAAAVSALSTTGVGAQAPEPSPWTSYGIEATGGDQPSAEVSAEVLVPAGDEPPAAEGGGEARECRHMSIDGFAAWWSQGVAKSQGRMSADAGNDLPLFMGDAMPWVPGQRYASLCDDMAAGEGADIWVYEPGTPAPAPPEPATMAVEASRDVPLLTPLPRTSPPNGQQVVGLPTWLWIEAVGWGPATATAEVPGLAVTVTATPRHVVWDMGNGDSMTCTGPGTAWDPAGPDDQATDCSYTYQFVSADRPGGTYTVTTTVVWAVTWEATNGETGVLPDATRSAAVELTVGERQAVVSYGG
jgi:hypothetical protein